MSVLSDYLMFLKLFVFMLFIQWLYNAFGNNRFLFLVGLLVGGYYIFFAQWSILGVLLVGFVVFIMSGLGMFMQDIIFQYGSVVEREAEASKLASPYLLMKYMGRGKE